MSKAIDILTPVGRLVGGSPFEPQTTDAEGNPLLIKHGPNAGQPRVDYYLALAVPKTDPIVNAFYGEIVAKARQDFPSMFDAAGNCINPKFAFKVTDGDSQVPNSKGKKPCEREGYPGCWVFHFSGGFAPQCYTAGGASVIADPAGVKCGDYVRIYGNVNGNGAQNQPGVYLNHRMLELVGYGEPIVFGPSGSEIFGGAPVAVPAGASATPIAPATPIAQAPAAPPTAPAAPQAPAAPPTAPAAPPAAPPAPAPDFLNGPVVKYAYNGAEYTAEQLKGWGWTDAQIATLQKVDDIPF